jgi:hypothetical protein
MDELSASSTNNLIFVPSKHSYWDSLMSSVTDKQSTVRNTWNRKYRIRGDASMLQKHHLQSLSAVPMGSLICENSP